MEEKTDTMANISMEDNIPVTEGSESRLLPYSP